MSECDGDQDYVDKFIELERPENAAELIWSIIGLAVPDTGNLADLTSDAEEFAGTDSAVKALIKPMVVYMRLLAEAPEDAVPLSFEEEWESAVNKLTALVSELNVDTQNLEVAKQIKNLGEILVKLAKQLRATSSPDLTKLKENLASLVTLANGDWKLDSPDNLIAKLSSAAEANTANDIAELSDSVGGIVTNLSQISSEITQLKSDLDLQVRPDRRILRDLVDKSDQVWNELEGIQTLISDYFHRRGLSADSDTKQEKQVTEPNDEAKPESNIKSPSDSDEMDTQASSVPGEEGISESQEEPDRAEAIESDPTQDATACEMTDSGTFEDEARPSEDITSIENSEDAENIDKVDEDRSAFSDRLSLEQLIHEGNFSLAYWMGLAKEAAGHAVPLDAAFLGATAAAITDITDGALGSSVRGLFSEISGIDHYGKNEQILVATALISALLLAGSAVQSEGHFQTLANSNLKCGVEELNELLAFVIDNVIRRGWSPSRLALLGVGEVTSIENRLNELSGEALDFLGNIKQVRFSYQPAHVAFLEIFAPESNFHALLSTVADKNPSERMLKRVEAQLNELDPNFIVNNLSDFTSYKGHLQGSARSQFASKLSKALDIANRWHSLMRETRIASTVRNADQLERKLRTLLTKAIEALEMHEDRSTLTTAIATGSSISLSTAALMLAGQQPSLEPSIGRALIRFADIELDNEFNPVDGQLIKLLDHSPEEAMSDQDMISECLTRHEYPRALELAKSTEDADRWHEEIEKKKSTQVRDLLKRCEQAEEDIEDVNLLGLLVEEFSAQEVQQSTSEANASANKDYEQLTQVALSRAQLLTQIADAVKILESVDKDESVDIRDASEILTEVTAFVSRKKRERQKDFKQKIEDHVVVLQDKGRGGSDAEYINGELDNCLAAGDNVALAELFDRVDKALREGKPVDRVKTDDEPIADRFLQDYDFLDSLKKRGGLVNALSKGVNIGGLKLANRDKPHRERAMLAVTEWLKLREKTKFVRNDEAVISACKEFLNFVGISEAQKISFSDSPGQDILQLEVQIDGSLASPIPAFGSELKGLLRVVLFGTKQQPRKIIQILKKVHKSKAGILVIHLDSLSARQRLDIRDLCIREKVTCAILDFALLAHLCGARDPLITFFDIVLPLTWSQPYLMAGENVPKEMFVGRSDQVNDLKNPTGSCIVFGGRQLGKSALLRHLAEQHHSPQDGIYIAYRDIDDLGNPPQTERDMEQDLWFRISQEIHHIGFLSQKEQISLSGGKVTKKNAPTVVPNLIRSRLEEHENERLILLLDEVDDMLDMDLAQDFRVVTNLRALMSETGRRFKVVFTGLKSVQRFQNYENQPFTQLGAALVVRPLPARDAEDLVRRPLRALGYIFETPTLVLRVLSQSNYHPGLIQIFCYRLLENLNEQRDRSKAVQAITRYDVNLVERDADFMEDIRNRFDWTLDLDERYKVLTYALVMSESASLQLTVPQFKNIGKNWWPQVFENMNRQTLRGLLDEMEGLGVLLKIAEGNQLSYRLRSPNLLRLLGSKDDIESEMLRIIGRPSPSKRKPRNFHRLLDRKRGLFGAMTMEQESQIVDTSALFRICLIYGSNALGINLVAEHIRYLMQSLEEYYGHAWDELNLPSSVITAGEKKLAAYLKDKMKPHKRSHLYTICNLNEMPSDVNPTALLRSLMEEPGRVCKTLSQGRVILIADEESSWNLLSNEAFQKYVEDESRLVDISLQRWSDGAIAKALDDLGLKTRARENGEYIFSKSRGLHTIVQESLRNLKLDGKSLTREAISKAVDEAVLSATNAEARLGVEICNDELRNLLQEILDLGAEEGEDRLPWDVTLDLIADSYPDLLGDGGRAFRMWIQTIGLAGPAYRDGQISLVTYAKSLIH